MTAFVARGGESAAVWDDSALVDSLVASTASLEGLRKRAAAARAERSAAAARLTRYRGIAQLAAVLHVLCRDLGARDPRYSLPFVQHAGIFKRALQLTRVATKGTSGTGQRPRSREKLGLSGTAAAAAAGAAGSPEKGESALAPAPAAAAAAAASAAAAAADDDELGGLVHVKSRVGNAWCQRLTLNMQV